jgi:hypothetical protein
MMGIPYGQKARDQTSSFAYDTLANKLFISTNTGYCGQDGAGQRFDKAFALLALIFYY